MKPKINFIVDALMFLCMAAIGGIGLLIKYVLIAGKDRWVEYGRNVDLQLFGLDRHEWGNIHLVLGYVLFGLLAIHIFIHWKAIVCLCRCTIKWSLVRIISVLAFVFISLCFIVIPFIIKPEILEIEKGNGRHSFNLSEKTLESDTLVTKEHKENTLFEVKGYMTLEEISVKYNIPSSYIKTQLNIPASISDKQKLGQLKKEYSFTMNDIETIITKYKKTK